jgi:hypothetical protein
MNLILGAALVAAGILLFAICYPARNGNRPALLRSDLVATNVPVAIIGLCVTGAGLLYLGLTS